MPPWSPESEKSGEGKRSEVREALEIVRETAAESASEMAREKEARDREELEGVLESLERESEAPTAPGRYRADLYGDFAAERQAGGRIVLEGDTKKAAEAAAEDFRRDAKTFSNLVAGEKIAAEYETKTGNFRAQTRLAELPDGRKIFMAYDYQGSWIHRGLDGLMKRLNGLPMRKAERGEWKRLHELKSPIPVIEHGDPHMAMMPYVPNANAKDVFAHNAEIGDFGTCDWADGVGLEEKNALAGKIVDAMREFHASKGAWGEAVLSNVIFTEKQEPTLCDFEVVYDEGIPQAEAKARDLKDMCTSVAAALEAAHGQDVGVTVKNLLDRYADPDVIAEAKKLASKKRGVLANLFFGYEQARSGAKDKKQYDAVRAAVAAYEMPEKSA